MRSIRKAITGMPDGLWCSFASAVCVCVRFKNSLSFLSAVAEVVYGALLCVRREKQWTLPAARCDPHQFS